MHCKDEKAPLETLTECTRLHLNASQHFLLKDGGNIIVSARFNICDSIGHPTEEYSTGG